MGPFENKKAAGFLQLLICEQDDNFQCKVKILPKKKGVIQPRFHGYLVTA